MTSILVRAPQWLGDAVVSTLFLSRLREREKSSTITVLTEPALAPLYKAHPAVNGLLLLSYRNGGSLLQQSRRIKEGGFDVVYILPRSLRTALEAWLAGIPQRIGFEGDGRRFFLTQAVSADARLAYPLRYLKLIGDEGASLDGVSPFFPQAEPTEEEQRRIFGAAWRDVKKPILGLAPASIAPARTWAPERFAEVAAYFLKQYGGTVLLFGSEREKAATSRVKSLVHGPVIDTAGLLSLPHLGWTVAQCQQLVVNDSGIMHVASAFNVPTVVLFGASNPTAALPLHGRFQAIQHNEVPCVPCLRNYCVRFGDHHKECLRKITSEEVAAALARFR